MRKERDQLCLHEVGSIWSQNKALYALAKKSLKMAYAPRDANENSEGTRPLRGIDYKPHNGKGRAESTTNFDYDMLDRYCHLLSSLIPPIRFRVESVSLPCFGYTRGYIQGVLEVFVKSSAKIQKIPHMQIWGSEKMHKKCQAVRLGIEEKKIKLLIDSWCINRSRLHLQINMTTYKYSATYK